MNEVWPTADQVATAIVAASRETGADPIEVAMGWGGAGTRFHISRARSYAVLAIRAIFSEIGSVGLATLVGGRGSFVTTLDNQLKHKRLPWWNDDVFMRVVKALEKVCPEAAPE